MADLLISPVLQVVLDKLASPAVDVIGNVVGVADNIKKLRRTLDVIQYALEDAEDQLLASSDRSTATAAGIWLSNLKDFAYDALYLLLDYEVLDFSSFCRQNSEKLRFVLSELERVVDKVLDLNTIASGGSRPPIFYPDWTKKKETSYPVKESEVYGRQEDRANVVNLLLSSDLATHGGDVPCVIVEGMTAIGKTTLAQLAYNDVQVTQHFDVKVWVFVSHHFDAKKILAAIVESITHETCSLSSLPVLHSAIERLLQDKRFLIVLDDVWTERNDDWDKLRPLFGGTGSKYGSRILITTQNKRIGLTLNISQRLRYSLKGLSEDHCWGLFRQLAFKSGEEEKYPTLSLIGQEIARKCGGVALAAKSLGSLLRFDRIQRKWLYVRDNELWNLDDSETGILPALKLSYSRLPRQLRRCFAFCSIFPPGYEIKKEKLIQLWMAEGLIVGKGYKRAEDIGSHYFDSLLWLSFFEEKKQCDGGHVTGYKMHDVIYNLARSISKSEYAIRGCDHVSAPSDFSKIRHSSVVCHFNSPTIPAELYEARLLTFLLFSGGNFRTIPRELFVTFRYLFVLDLSGSGVEVLEGKFLSKLVHLKFLDLSYTQIRELPPEIGDLLHLQTLNLFHCYNLVRLQLASMRHLKYLNNAGCEALTTMCQERNRSGSSDLPFFPIKRLPLFVIEKSEDIMLLGNFELEGNLKLTWLENVHDAKHARCANLGGMEELESLGFFWKNNVHHSNIDQDEESVAAKFKGKKQSQSSGSSSDQVPRHDPLLAKDILCNLGLPPHLRRLVIAGYPGIEFPDRFTCHWNSPSSPITIIHFIGCRNIKHLLSLGQLPSLKCLVLQEMHALRCIESGFYGGSVDRAFSSLQELTLIDFPNLEEWSSPVVEDTFPLLTKLILSGCPKLIEIPVHLRSIQHLELRHCKSTLVHSFRSLTSLEDLVIEGVNDLFDFPNPFPGNNPHLTSLEIKSCLRLSKLPDEMENLTSLKSLTIHWCEDLSYLPLRWYNLTALESLEISDCPILGPFPNVRTQGFKKLRTLYIENCNKLTYLPSGLQYLTSLEHLSIVLCSNLQLLPQSVEHLSSLRSLTITNCDKLTSLPEGLQNLNRMHVLEIGNCSGIQALPEWIEKLASLRSLTISGCANITSLPEGVKGLTALQHLSIQNCPQLLERCKRESGEDWTKIAHVPHKHIGQPEQRHQGEAAGSSSSA